MCHEHFNIIWCLYTCAVFECMYIHVILIPESMHIHVHVVCEKIHMSTCSYEQYFHGAWSISQILYICEVMNRPEYMPQNPTYENLPNIYDTRFTTIQPYLHNVSSCTSTCTHMFSCTNKFHLSLRGPTTGHL